MKNLFAVNMTDNKDATDFDVNPYRKAHVSAETEALYERALEGLHRDEMPRELTAEEAALKQRARVFRWVGLISLVGAMALFFVQGDRADMLLTAVQMALLVVSLVTTFLARRMGNKLNTAEQKSMEDDFSVVAERLNEAAAQAAVELGVPKDAATLEVLPFHYKLSGGEAVSVDKRGHFDNLATSAWVKGEELYLATAQDLFCIPLSDIRAFHEIDETFEIDFWLKDEKPSDEKYKEFEIRSKAGFWGKKCRRYYAVELAADYEILIPGYDWAVWTGLVSL